MSRLTRLVLAAGVLALTVWLGAGGAGTQAPPPHPVPVPAPADARALAAQDTPDPVLPAARATGRAASVPGGSWRALGPAPIGPPFLSNGDYYGAPNSGRVTGLVVLSGGLHPGRIVIGSAGGGVWTSDNGGQTWTPRTDGQPNLAIGAVAVDPSNPNHLLAGTGEANQSDDSYFGNGIFVSTNGGNTWTLQDPGGVFDGVSVAELAIVPGHSLRQFAATNDGLYMTTDGGTSWAKPSDASYAAVDGNITAVAVSPAHTSTVYLAGGPSLVAKSTDGGVHWTASATNMAPPTEREFVALAIAPSAPSVMWAAVGSLDSPNAVYRSKDAGATWSTITVPDYAGDAYAYGNGTEEQGWYDNAIAIDPANQAHVALGGLTVIDTQNAGGAWRNLNGQEFQWPKNKLHPSTHALAIANGKVWMGSDGGVYTYTSSTHAIANLNGNLNISQFYTGFSVAGTTVLGGTQGNSSARTSSGKASSVWTSIYGGDGGPAAITPNRTGIQLITSNGLLWSTTDGFVNSFNLITPPITYIATFNPPVAVIPNSAKPTAPTAFFCSYDCWRTTNVTAASPLWRRVTRRNVRVTAIAVSPSDASVVYVGFADHTIQVSTDQGLTFTNIGHEPGASGVVTGISVDPGNPKAITASFAVSNTRVAPAQPHVAQYSYSTNSLSGAWTLIGGDLPGVGVSHVVYDSGALLAATDNGVYGTALVDGSSTQWTRVGTGMPNVQVQDVAVVGGVIFAATHGRGVWRMAPS